MSRYIKHVAGLTFLLFLTTTVKAHVNRPIRIACIGNSVTYGYGLKSRETECYPARLQQSLGKGYNVKNFGHSGATLLKHGHNPYFKTEEFTDALNYKPDVAIIHLGLNDTDPRNWPNYKMDFEADYTWLLDTLRKVNPKVKLYVCRLTPIFSGHPRFKSGTRDWYWQIQSCISAVTIRNQAELINLNTPLHNRPDLFADQLHPDAEGASIIAQTIFQRITGNFGGLQLASIFNSHMVIQRSRPIFIYGSANAGERVEVIFGNQKKSVSADQEGKWRVEFPALAAGGPYVMKVQGQKKKMVLQDILIGDVWLCSGQSNMAFPLKSAATGGPELKNLISNPLLRLFKFEGWKETDNSTWDSVSLVKANQLKFFFGNWSICTAKTAADFTAVGYYFGKQVVQEEGVPIGLIELAVGGSTTESWIDRKTMENDDLLVDELSNWRKSDFIQPWVRERADTNLKAALNPKQRHPYEPCYNYEAGLDSLTKFQIKGVIWYQGESNTHNVELHDRLFQNLVKSWRQQWGYEFPFYYVQLSSIDRPTWTAFRAAQRKLQFKIPNTAMAVTSDLGDSLNVHPTRKREVGERLAKLALKYTYQKNIEANGPEVMEAVWLGNEIVVSFNHATVLKTSDQKIPTGFELFTDRGLRIPVKAEIRGTAIYIVPPPGLKPKLLLYAWKPFTRANLVNEAELPASTFSISIN